MSVSVTRAMLRDLSPAQAAARWQILFDAGGPVEAGLFEEWLDASEENGAAWAALDHAWSQFEDADDAIFADVRAEALSALVSARARPLRLWHIGAVAGLAVAVIGGVLFMPRQSPSPAQVADADQLYQTGQDGRGITLADGSRITLSPNSRIRVAMGGGDRKAALEQGRAVFSVRHDAGHPFTLTAGGWTVTDLGTRFSVGLAASRIEVALLEGGVRIEDGRHPATVLQPGQAYSATQGQQGEVTTPKPAGEAVPTDGMAEFDAVPLTRAIAQFNEVNATKLFLVDPEIGDLHISGRFRLGDPNRFADMISRILPIRASRAAPDRIELRKRR